MTVTIKFDGTQFNKFMNAMSEVGGSLKLITSILGGIRDQVKRVADGLLPLPATSVELIFKSKGAPRVPVSLPDNQQDTFSIVGKDAQGVLGAQLAPGQTITVVSSDPATVVVALDPSPLPVPAGETAPEGTATVASGVVKSALPPANPNVAVAVTTTIINADGSPFTSVVDTVTITPGALETVGELFGTPVPLA